MAMTHSIHAVVFRAYSLINYAYSQIIRSITTINLVRKEHKDEKHTLFTYVVHLSIFFFEFLSDSYPLRASLQLTGAYMYDSQYAIRGYISSVPSNSSITLCFKPEEHILCLLSLLCKTNLLSRLKDRKNKLSIL